MVYRRTLVKMLHGIGCVGSAICVGSSMGGASVGTSVGGMAVFVGNGCGVLVGMGASVGILVGIVVGIPIIVGVGMSVFVGMAAALLRPLTDGFVPQSMFPLRQRVTRACNTAGSHA